MRYSRMRLSHKVLLVFLLTVLIIGITTLRTPSMTGVPSSTPVDKSMEDLTRVVYPSLSKIKWHGHFILPQETLEGMFGPDWIWVARMNRIDRRHIYPGMTIKVPDNIADIRGYTPLEANYEPAKRHEKYILVDITEQWLGAYENGKLVFLCLLQPAWPEKKPRSACST